MMLKTSSNKVNPSSNMFKFGLKSNLGITVLITIAFLLICPSYMLIDLRDFGGSPDFRQEFFRTWNSGFSTFCGFASAISVVGINLLNFSFMFKRNSSDFIDSLPVTRSELFVSKVFSGYIISLIPSIVSLLALGICSACFGYSAIFFDVLISIVYIMVVAALCSTFSMLFIVASANVFDFLIGFAVINAGLLLLGLIAASLIEDLLIGIVCDFWNILKGFSPIFYTFYDFCARMYGDDPMNIGFFIKNGIMILIFFVLSLILYKKRKAESTGKAFAYRFIYVICAIMVAICTCYALGATFAEYQDYFYSPVFYIFGLIGAVVSSVIYGAITFRGFKTVKKSILIGVISFAVLVLSMIIIKSDPAGLNKKIPDANDIKSVEISACGGQHVTYTDPDFPVKLHKKIVNGKNIIVKDHEFVDDASSIEITYSLKDGGTLTRLYQVRTEMLSDEIIEMLNSDERFDGITNSLNAAKVKTVSLYISNDKQDYYKDTYLTYKETMKFLKLYRQESAGQTKLLTYRNNEFYYQLSWSEWDDNFRYEDFFVSKKYKKTVKYLESLDLEKRTADYE